MALMPTLDYRDRERARRDEGTLSRHGPAATVLVAALVLAIVLLLVGVVFAQDERVGVVCFWVGLGIALATGAFAVLYAAVSRIVGRKS